MRLPVVDTRGVALMPCTEAKARHLFKSGKARPKRDKLGLLYVQLTYSQEPENQPLVAGVDPGSKFEAYSVVGTKDTVLNLMVEAPNHVSGFDRKKQTISLHEYRTNIRLTQGAKVKDCRVLTWVAFRSWLVAENEPQSRGKGAHPSLPAPKKGRPIPPLDKSQGSLGPIR